MSASENVEDVALS